MSLYPNESRHRTRHDGPRRGFSLMELFLVITILSVIAVITFPLLRRPLNECVVQDAGQQLLRELAAARSAAIESGRPLLFQYQAGSGRYYIGPQDQRLETAGGARPRREPQLVRESAEEQPARTGPSSAAPASGPRSAGPIQEILGELPGDVRFLDQAAKESNADLNACS
ncbi:MAG: Tfp pilus assembly protein FimT/FimU, partial [Planctomycetota bacterium]